MEGPLVSVVVAIYKSERFLNKLIDSILNQTYRNLDIILVDDGSPDNSGRICDEYVEMDNRITVIHKENGGACDARNRGIEQAKGEYLTIVDGDDWLANDHVEYLLGLIERPGVNMSMTDSVFTTRDLKQNETDEIVELTSEEAIARIIYPRIPIGPWNKMYNMDLIREAKLTFCTKWSGEGLYYSVMAAQASGRVAVGHKRIYYYRMDNANSGLTNYNVEMGRNALENIVHIKESLVIRTPKTLNACNWHIWKNWGYLLFLIVATGQEEKYENEYRDCIGHLRRGLLGVLVKSELGLKEKIGMFIEGVAPGLWARRALEKESKAREADRVEARDGKAR